MKESHEYGLVGLKLIGSRSSFIRILRNFPYSAFIRQSVRDYAAIFEIKREPNETEGRRAKKKDVELGSDPKVAEFFN